MCTLGKHLVYLLKLAEAVQRSGSRPKLSQNTAALSRMNFVRTFCSCHLFTARPCTGKASVVHSTKVCTRLRLAGMKLEVQAEGRLPRLGQGQQLLWLAYPGEDTAQHADCAQAA